EGDRPIAWILPDRSIAVIHQLIAVVFEFLAEVVEHRPRFVAGRATQAVFSGEGRQGIGAWAAGEHHEHCKQDQRTKVGNITKTRMTRNAHGRTPRQRSDHDLFVWKMS